jgi:hypothetical protein
MEIIEMEVDAMEEEIKWTEEAIDDNCKGELSGQE